MPNKRPFAIRLIGFDDREAEHLAARLALKRGKSPAYCCLHEDNLRDPDLFIANAGDLKALAKISYLSCGDIRPALLIGTPVVSLPYPCLATPFEWSQLLAMLDTLVGKRTDTLSRLQASKQVLVPERRRCERLDIDLTEPGEYERMRHQPAEGGVLVVDKTEVLRDYLAEVLAPHMLTAGFTNDELEASDYCGRFRVSVVLINTSTPGIDPYDLCSKIRQATPKKQLTVIFLAGRGFSYDAARARTVGCNGFLGKPLAQHHLLSTLKKFLPLQ